MQKRLVHTIGSGVEPTTAGVVLILLSLVSPETLLVAGVSVGLGVVVLVEVVVVMSLESSPDPTSAVEVPALLQTMNSKPGKRGLNNAKSQCFM